MPCRCCLFANVKCASSCCKYDAHDSLELWSLVTSMIYLFVGMLFTVKALGCDHTGCKPAEAGSMQATTRDLLSIFLIVVNIALFIRFSSVMMPAIRKFIAALVTAEPSNGVAHPRVKRCMFSCIGRCCFIKTWEQRQARIARVERKRTLSETEDGFDPELQRHDDDVDAKEELYEVCPRVPTKAVDTDISMVGDEEKEQKAERTIANSHDESEVEDTSEEEGGNSDRAEIHNTVAPQPSAVSVDVNDAIGGPQVHLQMVQINNGDGGVEVDM